MADFVEWYESTGGADNEDDLVRELQESAGIAGRAERDAVLFLVDSSASMFTPIKVGSEPTAAGSSAFSRAIQCALTFYQEKIITNENDVVALALYNTAKKLNLYDFNGVYIFHEFDSPGAARVQELQVLGKAGVGVSSSVYTEFVQHIGHAPPRGALLSEALWAAQHMFHNLKSKMIGYRRIFLFTDSDDPCAGISMERERCCARMKDLHDAGVALEVFAHGVEAVATPIASTTTSSPRFSGSSSTPSGPVGTGTPVAPVSASSSAGKAVVTASGPSSYASAVAAEPPHKPKPLDSAPAAAAASCGGPLFVRSKFWDSLLAAPLYEGAFRQSGSVAALTPSDEEYCGTVHVSAAIRSFDSLLSDVKLRAHPQRSAGRYEMRVGYGAAHQTPRVIVKVYIPVLRCSKPKFKWLNGQTNTAVTAETRLLSKATGAPVADDELRYSTEVGGEEVFFTKEESQRIRSACAGAVGLTVLGFKAEADAIKLKYNISRSAFLHATAQDGGGVSALKFFVQLHRTLSKQNKVCIAELVSRAGVPPRLVALVPSHDAARSASIAENVIADSVVRGLGFHLVSLPYADDIRSVSPPPLSASARPSSDHVLKAKRIIRKLQVDYDPTSIANPSLQRQYAILQQLALIDADEHVQIDDLTLPDVEGMKKLSPVFKDFAEAVLPPHYAAELICPQPKPAKKPPSASELSTVDFDDLEKRNMLDTLTIPYLVQYLKLLKEDTNGAKVKAELVARVAEVVRRRRTMKREREDE